jgi:hypothetical protein
MATFHALLHAGSCLTHSPLLGPYAPDNLFSFRPVKRRCFLIAGVLLWFFFGTPALSHPLQTEPLRYPHIAAFDQNFLTVDPDETLVRGGLLLLAELSCTACHAAPPIWQHRLAPRPGPNLAAVGSRYDEDTLWLMVRSPQYRKRGTLMPGLFGSVEGDVDKVEAITRYLSTLRLPAKPLPLGDAVRGRLLYHTVGCVACHQPATDYLPLGAASAADLEPLSTASSPIALADAYEIAALGRFLLNPHKDRPAGRMPGQRLTEQEAADIAAYLHIGRTAEKAVERTVLQLPAQTSERGRELFIQQRCANCHLTDQSMPHRMAKPMLEVKLDGPASCVATSLAPGTPRFDLNELQLRALRLALHHVQQQAPAVAGPDARLDWQLLRLNCYACHDRNHKGGPEDARAIYFGHEQDRYPPSLDHVGSKLTSDALKEVLHGDRTPTRSNFSVRMPDFGKVIAEQFSEAFTTADKSTE